MSNPLLIPVVLFAFVAMFIAAAAIGRSVEARRKRRRRVVEKPNSHHTWERVRVIEARERWHDMPLDQIHEVNREEVTRLLARVSALGADSLRPQERRFLDQMTELYGPAAASGSSAAADRPDASRQAAPDLRHRTA